MTANNNDHEPMSSHLKDSELNLIDELLTDKRPKRNGYEWLTLQKDFSGGTVSARPQLLSDIHEQDEEQE